MDLIVQRPEGLYCPPGDFYIDPWRPVDRAVITHAHGDHARMGHGHYLAAAQSEGVLRSRLGEITLQTLNYGEAVDHHGMRLSQHPAGHVLAWHRTLRCFPLDAKNAKKDAKAAKQLLYSSAIFASFFATLASKKTSPRAVPCAEWIPAFAGMTEAGAEAGARRGHEALCPAFQRVRCEHGHQRQGRRIEALL